MQRLNFPKLVVLLAIPLFGGGAASGCADQGEGEVCDFGTNGNKDCESGLVCVSNMTPNRCCPPSGSTDERCIQTGVGGVGGSAGSGGAGGAAGSGGTGGSPDASDSGGSAGADGSADAGGSGGTAGTGGSAGAGAVSGSAGTDAGSDAPDTGANG